MSYWTTSLALIAGICVAFGLLQAFFGWHREGHRRIHFEFAAFALLYAGTNLAARSAYLGAAAENFVAAERITVLLAEAAWVALLWFVADYTGFAWRKTLWALTSLSAAFAVLVLVAPELMVGEAAGVAAVQLPWGEEVLRQSADAPLLGFISLVRLAALAFLSMATVHESRRGGGSRAAFLVGGLGWFVAAVVADIVLIAGGVDFVYISDLGFLGFLFAMSIQLAQTTVDTERDLLAYQSNLVAMVEERTEELARAQTELVKRAAERAATDERDRLARDLHDVVTQTLFSVNLIASSLPHLWRDDPDQAERSTSELRRLTRAAMAEMRTLLRELRPDTIVETGLDTLIDQLVEGLATRHDLERDVDIELTGALPPSVHIAVYRIAQEAMNNVAKHANADRLSVSLRGDARWATLNIEDDGEGFDRGSARDGSMGLDIMQERASAVGAHLEIQTAPGSGTSVHVVWSHVGR